MTKISEQSFDGGALMDELASDPATPPSGTWRVYPKSGGLYLIDDAGSVVGPLGTGSGSGGGWSYPANGRLTLESGVPASLTDQTAKTTVYYTPFRGDEIATYDGAAWSISSFTEKSLSLSGFTANLPYDIFIVDGTLALEAVAWTSATARATALTTQDGVLVKSGDATRRYLGTICITSTTGQCEDSTARRFVWNYYYRLPRHLSATDATASWTYATATWRQANAASANKIEMICGVQEQSIEVTNTDRVSPSTSQYGIIGIGHDRTDGNDASNALLISPSGGALTTTVTSIYKGVADLGYHYFAAVEIAGGATVTFLGSGYLFIQSMWDC